MSISSNKKPKGLGKTSKPLRASQAPTLPSTEKPFDEFQAGLDEDELDYGDNHRESDSDSEDESDWIVPSDEEPVVNPKPVKQSARKPADDTNRLQRGMTAIGKTPLEETCVRMLALLSL